MVEDLTKFQGCKRLILGNLRLYAAQPGGLGALLAAISGRGELGAPLPVKEIDLTYISITPSDCLVLGNMLRHAPLVQSVYLECNGISCNSMRDLAGMIGI
jgi:hypothetical protein